MTITPEKLRELASQWDWFGPEARAKMAPSMKAMWPNIVRDVWRLMIDAALQEKTS